MYWKSVAEPCNNFLKEYKYFRSPWVRQQCCSDNMHKHKRQLLCVRAYTLEMTYGVKVGATTDAKSCHFCRSYRLRSPARQRRDM
jgi:hypothetical protein